MTHILNLSNNLVILIFLALLANITLIFFQLTDTFHMIPLLASLTLIVRKVRVFWRMTNTSFFPVRNRWYKIASQFVEICSREICVWERSTQSSILFTAQNIAFFLDWLNIQTKIHIRRKNFCNRNVFAIFVEIDFRKILFFEAPNHFNERQFFKHFWDLSNSFELTHIRFFQSCIIELNKISSFIINIFVSQSFEGPTYYWGYSASFFLVATFKYTFSFIWRERSVSSS